MGYAVEIIFDNESQNKFIDYWKLLYQSGCSSYMYEHGGNPHITFGLFNNNLENISILKEIIFKCFNNIEPFNLTFSTLGLFPFDEGVSFIAPKVSLQLLTLHNNFYKEICKNGLDKYFVEIYKPKHWIPHCTMTIQTNKENQIEGLRLLRDVFKPFDAQVRKIVLIKFFPIQILEEIIL